MQEGSWLQTQLAYACWDGSMAEVGIFLTTHQSGWLLGATCHPDRLSHCLGYLVLGDTQNPYLNIQTFSGTP